MDDVGLDGAEWLVLDQNKDLLLFLQADEVTEPGPLSQSASIKYVFDRRVTLTHSIYITSTKRFWFQILFLFFFF